MLNYDYPENIAFAANTHELVFRLLSCLDLTKEINILTTDSEFYSFKRQSERLYELPNVTLTRIEVNPINTFAKRFSEESQNGNYNFIYFSNTFYNSG